MEKFSKIQLQNACEGRDRPHGGINAPDIRDILNIEKGKYTRKQLNPMLCKHLEGKNPKATRIVSGASRNVQMSAEDYYRNGGGKAGDVCDRENGPRCLQVSETDVATWRMKKFKNGADCNTTDKVNCDVQNTSRPSSSRSPPRVSSSRSPRLSPPTSSSTVVRPTKEDEVQEICNAINDLSEKMYGNWHTDFPEVGTALTEMYSKACTKPDKGPNEEKHEECENGICRRIPKRSSTMSPSLVGDVDQETTGTYVPPSPVGGQPPSDDDLKDRVVLSTSRITLGVSKLLQESNVEFLKSNVDFLNVVLTEIQNIERAVDKYSTDRMGNVDGTSYYTPKSTST